MFVWLRVVNFHSQMSLLPFTFTKKMVAAGPLLSYLRIHTGPRVQKQRRFGLTGKHLSRVSYLLQGYWGQDVCLWVRLSGWDCGGKPWNTAKEREKEPNRESESQQNMLKMMARKAGTPCPWPSFWSKLDLNRPEASCVCTTFASRQKHNVFYQNYQSIDKKPLLLFTGAKLYTILDLELI